jgi:ribosomal protein S3
MEWYREGRVPLHTLRADLDYGTAEALTTFGIIGVKSGSIKATSWNMIRRPVTSAKTKVRADLRVMAIETTRVNNPGL